jgi:glycosyltransferase involved in cell wall biosynthesis
MPIAIEQLDLSEYDLVISSSHAVAKGVLTGPDQVHVSYVHSPMRYAWDLQPDYLRGGNGRGLTGLALRAVLHYLRMWDVRTVHGVDAIAANSQFIARRIAKAYGKSAQVIYPPVDVRRFTVGSGARDPFYVCISRLMPYKRVDLIIDAFRELPDRRLRVIGTGPELKQLAKTAPGNVELLGHQPDEVVQETLQRAQALVFQGRLRHHCG